MALLHGGYVVVVVVNLPASTFMQLLEKARKCIPGQPQEYALGAFGHAMKAALVQPSCR